MTGPDSTPLVIGLGGNTGTQAEIVVRFRQARAALEALAVAKSLRSAPLYRSAPIGPPQPAYLNTAVCFAVVDIEPVELLGQLQAIERSLGRDRTRELRWGPRTIDLDLLLWASRVIHEPALEVPHPRLAERKFALAPLVALLGDDVVIPGAGRAGELLVRVADQACEQVSAAW